jgi:mono/diheme cytochrome c family protein
LCKHFIFIVIKYTYMKKAIVVLMLAVFVFSCAKKNTPSAAATASPQNNSAKVVTESTPVAAPVNITPDVAAASPQAMGQSTYNAKCGRCHGLKPVGGYTADRWVGIMESMAPKAHLTDVEKGNVLAYVKANAKK